MSWKKDILEISRNEKTTIRFESPQRLKNLLNELRDCCGSGRVIQVSRELTKKYEEHIGNNIEKVISFLAGKEIIGEITIVIKGININRNLKFDESNLKKELIELVKAGLSLSAASKYLAKKNGLKKSEIYNMI